MKALKYFLIFFILAASLFAFYLYLGLHTKAQTQKTQNISFVSKEIKKENTNPDYILDVTYPQVENVSAKEKINSLLQSEVEKNIADFVKNVDDVQIFKGAATSSFSLHFEPALIGPKILSIRLNYSQYSAGAAHPISFIHPFNYLLNEQKKIEKLSDVFTNVSSTLSVLSSLSQKDLKKQFGEDYEFMKDTIENGTAPKEENFQNFIFEKENFVIIFNPYEVAPYAAGILEVKIPYSELRSFFRQNFL